MPLRALMLLRALMPLRATMETEEHNLDIIWAVTAIMKRDPRQTNAEFEAINATWSEYACPLVVQEASATFEFVKDITAEALSDDKLPADTTYKMKQILEETASQYIRLIKDKVGMWIAQPDNVQEAATTTMKIMKKLADIYAYKNPGRKRAVGAQIPNILEWRKPFENQMKNQVSVDEFLHSDVRAWIKQRDGMCCDCVL